MSETPKDIVVGSKNGRLAGGKFSGARWYKRIPKQAVFLAALVVIAALGAAGWSWHQQSKQNQNTSAKHAKTQLLHEAGSKLAPQDSAALGPIVKQIEQQPDFDTDADYLYVLTTYYLNVNETDKAGDYLAKLKTAYDPAKGFDASIKPVSDWMTIEQLQSKLQAVKSPKKPTNPAGFGG